ncbi:MAG: tetratricopeptide repeat protein, partial [Bacteroidota bacterium]
QVLGDAFYIAFSSAENAMRAAIQSQSAIHAEEWGGAAIRVRMGIHTGTADLQKDGQYVGYLTLCQAERIACAAHGGQVLLSSTSEPLMRGSLPPDAGLRDLGEHRLKDLPRPERLFQLVIQDLQADFPPLRTLDSFPNNLPLQLTSFIGREKELADVKRLLSNSRLLTLIGPGGTGKSRLSLQAAMDELDTFLDGAWLVEFAPVSDPSAVGATVLAALDLPAEVHRPAIDMLCDYLQHRQALLILDNCEHLVDACARLVDRLLHAASRLQILASSREALGIAGEVSYRVPSLGLPDVDHLPALDSLSQYEAVKLFIDRARAAQPGFGVTNDNAPAVAQICHRLDGIPLAIELAAAKVRALSVDQIARRLDDRFRLLTGGSRTALERHQTLRATLDWSYNFLPAPEQMLFRALSTFVKGWTLEAAESVCAFKDLSREDVFDLLEQLVNKSLVLAEERGSETRYRLLETMRQYAGEKLIEAGESELLHDRHLGYFLDLAETAFPHLYRSEQVEWLDRLEDDHDNLKAALEWSLGKPRPEQALRLAGALGRFWDLHSYWMEGARWVQRALAMPFQDATPVEKAARARALHADITLAGYALDDLKQMRASADASVALCGEIGDPLALVISKYWLAGAFYRTGDLSSAVRLLEEILPEFRRLEAPYWEVFCLHHLSMVRTLKGEEKPSESLARDLEITRRLGERETMGYVLRAAADYAWANGSLEEASAYVEEVERVFGELGHRMPMSLWHAQIAQAAGDFARARKLYKEAIETLELLGEQNLKSRTIAFLGLLARDEGNLAEAQICLERSLEISRELGSITGTAYCWADLGYLCYLQGNLEGAKSDFKESLLLGKSSDDTNWMGTLLILVACYLSDQAPHLAVRLLAAVHSRDAKQMSFPTLTPFYRPVFDAALAGARQSLGVDTFQAAWQAAESLSLADACGLALQALDEI